MPFANKQALFIGRESGGGQERNSQLLSDKDHLKRKTRMSNPGPPMALSTSLIKTQTVSAIGLAALGRLRFGYRQQHRMNLRRAV